jgi:ABC-type bacteriocin/lantibiotic exporter with double-glycine peptidase domain
MPLDRILRVMLLGPLLLASSMLPVPFVPQKKDTCAAAALAMVLGYWGTEVSQDDIAASLLNPELHGILGSRLEAFARARGFTAIAYAGDVDQLRDFVGKGRPLIVALRAGRDRYHNVVVVGFDETGRRVLVNDPAEGASRGVDLGEFEKRWGGAGHWTLLVLPEPEPESGER